MIKIPNFFGLFARQLAEVNPDAPAHEPSQEQSKPMIEEPRIFPLGHKENRHDISANRKFGQRNGHKPQVIVIHHGGFDATQIVNWFRSPDCGTSAQWATDHTGAYQMLSDDLSAWHATWANRFSTGIEICGVPDVRNFDRFKRMGLDVRTVKNVGRGPSDILTLDPRTAKHTRQLVEHLCKIHDIPMQFPLDANGKVRRDVVFTDQKSLGSWRGLVTHFHVQSNKWDAPVEWLDQIFPEMRLK